MTPDMAPDWYGESEELMGKGWQPIDTAPKDGTWVLLTLAGVVVETAKWSDDHWRHNLPGLLACRWTHWQPLPPPPEVA